MRDSDRLGRRAAFPGYFAPFFAWATVLVDWWRRIDFLAGKASVLTEPWFAGAVTVIGVAYAAWIAQGVTPDDDRIDDGWLANHLKAMRGDDDRPLFNSKDFDDYELRMQCFTNLRDFGIFTKKRALGLLASRRVRTFLNPRYRDILRRGEKPYPSPSAGWYVEPNGFTHWGAMLHQASWVARRDVERYIPDRIRELRDTKGAK